VNLPCPALDLQLTARVTTVGKPSAIGQSTRPTQPLILSGSIKLQLDVGHNNQWRRHLVNAYEVEAGMVYRSSLQVKLCDPYLSALDVSLVAK